MDTNKVSYFVAKYRAFGEEDLNDLTRRLHELADEASTALRQVLAERGLPVPEPAATANSAQDLSPAEREMQTKLSTELWNSSLSKRVQFQFAALGICFSTALLGPQGLRGGVLLLIPIVLLLYYAGNRVGRRYTRTLCSDADRTIEEKRKALQNASLVLWPALIVPAALGFVLASAIRAA